MALVNKGRFIKMDGPGQAVTGYQHIIGIAVRNLSGAAGTFDLRDSGGDTFLQGEIPDEDIWTFAPCCPLVMNGITLFALAANVGPVYIYLE